MPGLDWLLVVVGLPGVILGALAIGVTLYCLCVELWDAPRGR